MIKHIWSVLCKSSSVNSDDNTISLRDVFESLQIFLKPAASNGTAQNNTEVVVPVEHEVVSFFLKEDRNIEANCQLELTIENSDGIETGKISQEFKMPKEMGRMRTRLKMSALKVQKSGNYLFKVYIREEGQKAFKQVAELPLEVRIEMENQPVAQL